MVPILVFEGKGFLMSILVKYIEEFRVVESLFDVTYTKQDIIDSTKQAVSLANEKGTNLYLADCTSLTRGRSVVEIYSFGDIYTELHIPRGSRQAVILSTNKQIESNSRFYETATRNKGYDVKVFNDRIEAIAWLING